MTQVFSVKDRSLYLSSAVTLWSGLLSISQISCIAKDCCEQYKSGDLTEVMCCNTSHLKANLITWISIKLLQCFNQVCAVHDDVQTSHNNNNTFVLSVVWQHEAWIPQIMQLTTAVVWWKTSLLLFSELLRGSSCNSKSVYRRNSKNIKSGSSLFQVSYHMTDTALVIVVKQQICCIENGFIAGGRLCTGGVHLLVRSIYSGARDGASVSAAVRPHRSARTCHSRRSTGGINDIHNGHISNGCKYFPILLLYENWCVRWN